MSDYNSIHSYLSTNVSSAEETLRKSLAKVEANEDFMAWSLNPFVEAICIRRYGKMLLDRIERQSVEGSFDTDDFLRGLVKGMMNDSACTSAISTKPDDVEKRVQQKFRAMMYRDLFMHGQSNPFKAS